MCVQRRRSGLKRGTGCVGPIGARGPAVPPRRPRGGRRRGGVGGQQAVSDLHRRVKALLRSTKTL